MKTATLCGIALLCSSASFAQTTAPAGTTPRMMTLTGCVGGGATAQPITLSNAMIVPTTDQPMAGGAVSPVPGAVSQPTTQPPGPVAGSAAAGVGTPGTAATGVGTAGTAGAGVGTAGTAATGAAGTGTAGAVGTAGAGVGTAGTTAAGVGTAAGTGSPVGTTGTASAGVGVGGAPVTSHTPAAQVSGTAPAGSSASSVTGYRLSGADMAGWVGRRVQIVGMLSPTTTPTSEANPATNATATTPEFRVVSVQPISGNCPPQQ